MKHILAVFLAWTALASSAAVIDGSYRIVIPDKEPTGLQRGIALAAEGLRDGIEESVGLGLPVVTASAHRGGKAIYIGRQFAERDGIDISDLRDFDCVVAERGGNVYLAGRDKGRDVGKPLPWHKLTLPSVLAVTRFMRTFMDVAFVMPGKVGADIPRRERIEIPDGCRQVFRPRLDYSSGIRFDILYNYANGMFGNGSFHGYGGHTYPLACPADTYFKDHPEYFALIGGKRVGDRHNPSLCISNPAVEALVIAEIEKRFAEGADGCQLGQQDGFTGCQCEKCRVLYGTGDDWGEKLWIFHRGIAEKLFAKHPGKYVRILSYGPTAHPPKTFKAFPTNVMVELCYSKEENFREWKGYVVPLGFTVYTYHWGEYPRPGFTAKQSCAKLAAAARLYLDNGVHGVYRCGYGELFGMEGPGYWTFNRILEDPSADVQALKREYCERAFGKAAAEPMLAFYDALDIRLDGLPGGRIKRRCLENGTPVDLFAYVYSAEMAKFFEEKLAKAEKTAGLTDKQVKRLKLVRTEFEYAKLMGRISALYLAYRMHPCREFLSVLGEAVKDRNAWLDELCTGPKKTPHPVEGWPEIRLFGNFGRGMLQTNGRLGARVGAPFGWDVDAMLAKGVLPGASRRLLRIRRTDVEPSASDFESGAWAQAEWNEIGGVQMQQIAERARFKVLYGRDALYLAMESDLKDDFAVPTFGRDGTIHMGDFAELVIDPTGQGERTYDAIWGVADGSFGDSACGLITDPLDPKYGTFDTLWDGKGWSITNARGGDRWQTSLKVPYATIGATPPKSGDRWRINVARCWYPSCHGHPPTVNALWSPDIETGAFKNPDAMGDLVFE